MVKIVPVLVATAAVLAIVVIEAESKPFLLKKLFLKKFAKFAKGGKKKLGPGLGVGLGAGLGAGLGGGLLGGSFLGAGSLFGTGFDRYESDTYQPSYARQPLVSEPVYPAQQQYVHNYAPAYSAPAPAPVEVVRHSYEEPEPSFVSAPAPTFVSAPAPAPTFVSAPAPTFVFAPAPTFVSAPVPAPILVSAPAPTFFSAPELSYGAPPSTSFVSSSGFVSEPFPDFSSSSSFSSSFGDQSFAAPSFAASSFGVQPSTFVSGGDIIAPAPFYSVAPSDDSSYISIK